jgi:hypothetical protein
LTVLDDGRRYGEVNNEIALEIGMFRSIQVVISTEVLEFEFTAELNIVTAVALFALPPTHRSKQRLYSITSSARASSGSEIVLGNRTLGVATSQLR